MADREPVGGAGDRAVGWWGPDPSGRILAMADVMLDRTEEREDGWGFRVTVTEAGSQSVHHVTLSRNEYERLGRMSASPEGFVKRCFEFLLERESKESILRRFDVREIATYFPDFEEQIRTHGGV